MPASTAPHLKSPALVGRDGLLAALDTELSSVLEGTARVLLLTGAAGLGKTRLLTEAQDRFSHEMTCLSARAYRWGSSASFGLWIEALDRHLRTLDPDAAERLLAGQLPGLTTLVKSMASPHPHRSELLEELVELFERLSAEQPVLITLDDLHLADTSSWEALRYLGRRLAGSPIAVLATARPAQLRRHPIAGEVLLGLEEDGLLRRVRLEPLRRDEVTRLAHDILRSEPGERSTFVPEPLVTWLIERSMGHPLFIIGLLRALVEEGADPAAPRLERIPESLRERVLLEVQALPPEGRALLEVLAVVERRTDLGDLARILDLDPAAFVGALEGLCGARLVDETATGATLSYEITHPIVADTIYQEIGGARRRALHRTVARTLLEANRLGSAAGHYARAAEPGDDEAVEALCAAMREAERRGLYQEALATLAALLEILPAEDNRWLRVLDAMLPQAEWVLSHLAEGDAATAVAAMERIQRHLPDTAHVDRGTVLLHQAAFLSFGAGRIAEAEGACRQAIAAFEAAREPEQALLARNELAWLRGCDTDLPEQAALARGVLQDAAAGGHTRAAIQAAGTAAYALGVMGRFDDAEQMYGRSLGMAREAGDTYRNAWGLAQQGLMRALAGRLDDGVAAVQAALEEDPAAPDAIAYEDLAHCYWLAGKLQEAVEALEQSAARRPISGSRRRGWGAALAARLHVEMGLRGRATSGLEQAQAAYGERHILVWSCWCDWTAGFLAWHDGDHEDALEGLSRTTARLESIGAEAYAALALVDTAEVAAAVPRPSDADAAAERLATIAAKVGGGLHPHLADLGAAWSHLASGRWQEALLVAEAAAAALGASGYALLHASALEAAGRALEPVDRAAAVEALSSAAGSFAACGAAWRQACVLSRMARLGSRGRRAVAGVQGPAALTQREREVARLAARGHTAQEIGDRLFIGRRTVETHLANAYAKLGVASKRELIRRADELVLDTPDPWRDP